MLNNLRAARIAAGLSTADAGKIIGRGQSTYSKIERGAVALDAESALILCKRFNLTLESLLVTA
jgi:DNA-binding XRE family transcriptional regulator